MPMRKRTSSEFTNVSQEDLNTARTDAAEDAKILDDLLEGVRNELAHAQMHSSLGNAALYYHTRPLITYTEGKVKNLETLKEHTKKNALLFNKIASEKKDSAAAEPAQKKMRMTGPGN